MDRLPGYISSSYLPFFKFVPISFIDVDRSFSKYKNILVNNKWSFKFPKLRKYLIFQRKAEGNLYYIKNRKKLF
jgi:hypothetical protein